MSKLDIVDRLESLGGCDPACCGRCKVCPDEVARDGAKEITALRTKLAEAIVVQNRSITRMVEMAEPGFIGAFAARDMAIERAEKAKAELAACSAAFDKQQEQLDRNADLLAEKKKQWLDLTDKDREECLAKKEKFGWWSVIDAIEAKLREKNSG